MPKFYINSGTGAQMSAADVQAAVQAGGLSPSSFFVESGSGRQIAAKDITFAAPSDGAQGGTGNMVFTPPKSPDGAVTSSDVITGKNQTQATGAAATALNPTGLTDPMMQYLQQRDTQNAARLDKMLEASNLTFDKQLAVDNQKYGEMFASLANQYQNASQAATALAAQLNPYSDPRISSATGGYIKTIDDKYAAQAASLKGQMNAAQALQKAQHYEAANKLIMDAEKQQNDFEMGIRKLSLDMYNSAKQESQFVRSQAQQSSQFDQSQKQEAVQFGITSEQRKAEFQANRDEFSANFGLNLAKFDQSSKMDAKQSEYIDAQIDSIYDQIRSRKLEDSGANIGGAYSFPMLGQGGKGVTFTPRSDLTAAQKNSIPNIASAVNLINEAEMMYALAAGTDYGGPGTTVLSRAKGLFRTFGTWTGIGPNPQGWTTYNDYVKARRALIAKGIMGEVGNLAQQEQLAAALAFPGKFSTPQEATNKFASIRQQILTSAEALGTVSQEGAAPSTSVDILAEWKKANGLP